MTRLTTRGMHLPYCKYATWALETSTLRLWIPPLDIMFITHHVIGVLISCDYGLVSYLTPKPHKKQH